MIWTDDPERDFARYDAEQEAELKRLPTCCECKEHIQDEHLYDIEGNLYCKECMEEQFEKWTEYVN